MVQSKSQKKPRGRKFVLKPGLRRPSRSKTTLKRYQVVARGKSSED